MPIMTKQPDGEHSEDLNVKSAFLHVLGDAAASVGVILAAVIIMKTGWKWVDPLMSVLIGVLILVSSWRVLRSSVHILVEGVPEGIKLPQVIEAISSHAGCGKPARPACLEYLLDECGPGCACGPGK